MRIAEWVRRHQILTFYALTFAIAWGLGFPFIGPAVRRGGAGLAFVAAPVALFSPALAGIAVSAVVAPGPKRGPRWVPAVAFLVTLALAMAVLIVGFERQSRAAIPPIGLVFVAAMALPPACVVASGFSRRPGVRRYLSGLVKPRGHVAWYLLAMAIFPVLRLLGIVLAGMPGRALRCRLTARGGAWDMVGLVAYTFVYQFFYANGLGEEIGWRGFALPRLLARFNPIIATLIIVLLWVPWHFPIWLAEGRTVFTWPSLSDAYFYHLVYAFINTWLYIRSGGSILVVGLAHASWNTAFDFISETDALKVLLAITVVLLIAIERMWRKLPADSPAVYRSV